MNEALALYLFTRLDSLKALLGAGTVVLVVGAVLLAVATVITLAHSGEAERRFHEASKRSVKPMLIALAAVCALNVLAPSKNDAIFIVAGTGVIEAAKSDGVQRVAGKAAAVVEKALDDYLAKGDKK